MSIERAVGIPGWMDPAELRWLAAEANRHVRIAEVGSWRGRSTAALADNTSGTVWAIDTWEGSPETDGDPDFAAHGPEWLYDDFLTRKAANVVPVRMTSREAAGIFAADAFDMVFIDGAHDTASVAADIAAWHPLLEPGGLICGHDYLTDTVRAAVDAAFPAAMSGPISIWYAT